MSEQHDLPVEIEETVRHLLSVAPDQRYAVAKELKGSLTDEELEQRAPHKLIHPEHDAGLIYDLAGDLCDLLGPGDRMLLAELLYEAVSLEEQDQVHENAIVDLRRRVKELEEGTVESIPADVVFREIEESLAEFRRQCDELQAEGMPENKARRVARRAGRESHKPAGD
jgi:hypothetical protein